jgi:hypothetical protein
MHTGYLGGTTLPDPRDLTLEQRVDRLERIFAARAQREANRRMWLMWYGCSALMGLIIFVIVYLAGSLD